MFVDIEHINSQYAAHILG